MTSLHNKAKMPTIVTLTKSFPFDSKTENEDLAKALSEATGILDRWMKRDGFQNWEDVKKYPDSVSKLSSVVNDQLNDFLKYEKQHHRKKHTIPWLSDIHTRNIFEPDKLEVVFKIYELNSPASIKLDFLISYQDIRLISHFGSYIVVSLPESDDTFSTCTIELGKEVSITSMKTI